MVVCYAANTNQYTLESCRLLLGKAYLMVNVNLTIQLTKSNQIEGFLKFCPGAFISKLLKATAQKQTQTQEAAF